MRRTLALARRVGLVGSVRAVEQTPELAHLATVLPLAFPESETVHIVRDGRDVVCSLLEKPWLKRAQPRTDDAGLPYGAYARFWVEPERREERTLFVIEIPASDIALHPGDRGMEVA